MESLLSGQVVLSFHFWNSHALVSMTHNWLVNTDGNGATARVVLETSESRWVPTE